MMTISVLEAARRLFYAPFYVCLAQKSFEAEGADVRFVSSDNSQFGAEAVVTGSVDIAWGGPSRVISAHSAMPDSDLVCFCEVVSRDPFLVVGKGNRRSGTIRDLIGPRIAIVSEVPTPWLCLQEDLRRAGIDPADINRAPQRTMSENVEALRRGEIDAVQVFEPLVEEALTIANSEIWYSGADRGPTSYTSFYARRGLLEARAEDVVKIIKAIYRTQRWFHAADAHEVASAIQSYFPHVSHSRIRSAVQRYKDLQIWAQDPRMHRSGYDRLNESFVSGGFTKRLIPFERAVDNSLAERVLSELSE